MIEQTKIIFDNCLNLLIPTTEEEEKVYNGINTIFRNMYYDYVTNNIGQLNWENIKNPSNLIHMNTIICNENYDQIVTLLKKVAIIKLNGGLGTSMECSGPKSAIKVKDGMDFLDIIFCQVEKLMNNYGVRVPLILMNSFNTDEFTQNKINQYKQNKSHLPNIIDIKTLNQHIFPRIIIEDKTFMSKSFDYNESWYPPGHANIYDILIEDGIAQDLLNRGIEYVFISNVDNLAATIDTNIIYHMINNEIDFIMEVTKKTINDVKGGTLINYQNKLTLFEFVQCPPDKINQFQDIDKFRIFNTNNLWISIKSIIDNYNKFHQIDIIVNEKFIPIENGSRKKIVQLEKACGAAIKLFNNPIGLIVDRNRFMPIKNVSDLFLIQSNLYEFDYEQKEFKIIKNINIKRNALNNEIPKIYLSDNYKNVNEYMRTIGTVPDMTLLDDLKIIGNITFGHNVKLIGIVKIENTSNGNMFIEDNTILENIEIIQKTT